LRAQRVSNNNLIIRRRLVPLLNFAFRTFMNDDKPFLPVLIEADRLHHSMAACGSIAGLMIDMLAPETLGAVAAAGPVWKGQNCMITIAADKRLLTCYEHALERSFDRDSRSAITERTGSAFCTNSSAPASRNLSRFFGFDENPITRIVL